MSTEDDLDPALVPAAASPTPSFEELAAQFDLPEEAIRQFLANQASLGVGSEEIISSFLATQDPTRGPATVRERQALRNAIVHAPTATAEGKALPPKLPPAKSPTERLLRRSAPSRLWPDSPVAKDVRSAAVDRRPIPALVLAVDIRHSSYVMTQAVDPYVFANTIERWIRRIKKILDSHDGWFGSFTGDGFLAYWPGARQGESASQIEACLEAVSDLFDDFERDQLPKFAANSRNYREDVALGVGLDHGDISLVSVGDTLTILGLPVVGATRLVDNAQGWEVLANNHLGVLIVEELAAKRLRGVSAVQTVVDVKDQDHLRAYAISYGWRQTPEGQAHS